MEERNHGQDSSYGEDPDVGQGADRGRKDIGTFLSLCCCTGNRGLRQGEWSTQDAAGPAGHAKLSCVPVRDLADKENLSAAQAAGLLDKRDVRRTTLEIVG